MVKIESRCGSCGTTHRKDKWKKAITVRIHRRNSLMLGDSVIVPKEALKDWVSDALKIGNEVKICGAAYNVSG